jgi:hypothetical protein
VEKWYVYVFACETLIYGRFGAPNAGFHKSWVPGHLGGYILYSGAKYLHDLSICFMSPFWHLEFWGGSCSSGKFVDPCPNTFTFLHIPKQLGHVVAQLVEALHYKLEGHGFDSRRCHWNFHWHNPSGCTVALGSTQPLTEMSTRSISWGGKGGRYVGLTILPPSCANCLQIWETQPPATLRACPGLQLDCFTFLFTKVIIRHGVCCTKFIFS